MQVTETQSEGLKREFKIVVPASDIQSQVTSKLEEIGRTARLPGFRPGKTPMSILKQRFGKAVMGEILETTVNTRSQQAMEERGLRPAHTPNVELRTFDEGRDLEFTVAMEVMPEIAPMDFSTLQVERLVAEADDKAVDEALQRVANQARKTRPVEEPRPAAKGDVAVIDFVGKLDGEPFAGGSANAYELELGAGTFIPGFEDNLIGAKAGDHVEVRVTFPEDYGAENLAGKEAVFDVDVKELREYEPAEPSDELAKTLGLDSLDALRQQIRSRIEAEYGAASRTRMKRELFDELEKRHEFAVPQGLVEEEFQGIWREVQSQLQGPQGEQLREGKSDAEIEAEYRRVAERRVRLGLLLAEVGRMNNITVSQDDLGRAMRAEIARYPGQEQKVFEFFQQNPGAVARLQAPILEDKVVDYVLELAQVTQRTVSPEDLLKDPDDAPDSKEEPAEKTGATDG